MTLSDRIRVLFLDIDGVLNSAQFFRAMLHREEAPTTAEERAIIETLRPHRDIPGDGKNEMSMRIDLRHLDPTAIGRLNVIVRDPNVAVVVSSVWRHGYTARGLQLLLASRGFEGRVIAKTPYGWRERGHEIQEWLDSYHLEIGRGLTCPPFPGSVESVAILDDDSDMGRWLPRLVKVDSKVGLQEADVARALELLNEPIG